MMEKPGISFFAMNFILLFVIIGFILIVFDLNGLAFVFEMMILLVFIFLLAFAMFVIYDNEKLGWTILGSALILLLLDMFFIILLAGAFETAHITTIFFSVIGLLVILLNLRTAKSDESEIEDEQETHENQSFSGHRKSSEMRVSSRTRSQLSGFSRETNDYYPYIDKMEPEEPKTESKIEKTFVPGKFVASKKANKFHVAKCDWAKRISKANQIWFNSGEEAKSQGFEADKCVS